AFALDAVSYLLSALFVMGLARWGIGRPAADRPPAGGRIRQFAGDLVEGFRYHRRAPIVRDLLLLLAVTALSAGGLNMMLVLIANQHFGLPAEAVGLISTAMAVGITLGNLLIAYVGDRIARPQLFAAGYLLSGGAALLVLWTPSFVASLGLFLVAGFANAAFHAPPDAWVQEVTDPRFRGRVFALRNVTINWGFVVSTLLAGFVTAGAWLEPTWAALAGLMMGGGILSLALPSLRSAGQPRSLASAGAPGAGGAGVGRED
ncbi:MAG TPA: MFS transporter, partial [Bacillota bacterium]